MSYHGDSSILRRLLKILKAILISLFVCVCFEPAHSHAATLLIKANTKDCFKCYDNFVLLNQIHKNIQVSFVFREDKEFPTNRFIETYMAELFRPYEILESTKLYNSLNKLPTSEFYLVDYKDSILVSNSLLLLPEYVDSINFFSEPQILKEIKLPEKENYYNGVNLLAFKNSIIISNYTNGSEYSIDLKSGNIIDTFYFSEESYRLLYEKCLNDDEFKLLYLCKDSFPNKNVLKPTYHSQAVYNDALFYNFYIPYIIFENGSFLIRYKYAIVKRENELIEVYPIEIPDGYNGRNNTLLIFRDTLYYSIRKSEGSIDDSFIAKYYFKEDSFWFNKLSSLILPESYRESDLGFKNLNYFTIDSLIFYDIFPFYSNLLSSNSYRIPFSYNQVKFDGYFGRC